MTFCLAHLFLQNLLYTTLSPIPPIPSCQGKGELCKPTFQRSWEEPYEAPGSSRVWLIKTSTLNLLRQPL